MTTELVVKGFAILFLLALAGIATARGDYKFNLRWPRIWPPMLTLYVLYLLVICLMTFAAYKTSGLDRATGLAIMYIGLMAPLLIGYFWGARLARAGNTAAHKEAAE